jgi:hypothetical protein
MAKNLQNITVKNKIEHQAFNRLVKKMYNTLAEVKEEMDNDFQLGSFSQDLIPSLQASMLEDLEAQGYTDKREGFFYILDESYNVHNSGYYDRLFNKFTFKLGRTK